MIATMTKAGRKTTPKRPAAAGADPDLPASYRDRITAWGMQWGIPDLPLRVTVCYSNRLRRSLGRSTPATGAIRLNPALAHVPVSLLEEVLCHEVAHVAARLRFGRRFQPHGPQWASLVHAAGFQPAARLATARLPNGFRHGAEPAVLFRHHCPVCGVHRTARRAVRQWRCRACLEAGLGGGLVITTVPVGR